MTTQETVLKCAPFIGGIAVLALGATTAQFAIVITGLVFTIYGFYHMVKTPKTKS